MSTNLLSDKSRSVLVARKRVYTDLDLNFTVHPVKKDLLPKQDLDAVKQSVKNLILTNYFERPFQAKLGGNIRALLFEPVDSFTALALKKSIVDVLHEYEPRVDNIVVQISDYADENAYAVTVGFDIISLNTTAEVDLRLTRLR